MRRAEAESEYKAAVAEAIASSELERAQALYDEAVRVESSYRTYSEDLLAAWGLTLAGTPAAAETAAAGTSGGGGRTAARKTDDEPAPPSCAGAGGQRRGAALAALAHTGPDAREQGRYGAGLLCQRAHKLRRHAVAAGRDMKTGGRKAA